MNVGRSFRPLPPRAKLDEIAAEIIGGSLAGYWSRTRSDFSDVIVRLFEHPEQWIPRVELFATRRGGVQAQGTVRLHEARSALEKFGLTVCCYLRFGAEVGQRNLAFYRLCWEDEVQRTPKGRVQFLSSGGRHRAKPQR